MALRGPVFPQEGLIFITSIAGIPPYNKHWPDFKIAHLCYKIISNRCGYKCYSHLRYDASNFGRYVPNLLRNRLSPSSRRKEDRG